MINCKPAILRLWLILLILLTRREEYSCSIIPATITRVKCAKEKACGKCGTLHQLTAVLIGAPL